MTIDALKAHIEEELKRISKTKSQLGRELGRDRYAIRNALNGKSNAVLKQICTHLGFDLEIDKDYTIK